MDRWRNYNIKLSTVDDDPTFELTKQKKKLCLPSENVPTLFSTAKSVKCGVSDIKQGMRKTNEDGGKKVKCTTNGRKT